MIQLNKEYTYKELCAELNLTISYGNSKIAQIKEIERCFEFYHPIDRRTKKEKKSYVFTRQLKEIEPIKNGGIREGQGRNKIVKDEEFDIIINHYITKKCKDYKKYKQDDKTKIYFTGDSISREFGLYRYADHKFSRKNFSATELAAYNEIFRIVYSKKDTIISRKIIKNEKVEIGEGIFVSKKTGEHFNCKVKWIRNDEFLSLYNKYERIYLLENGFYHIGQVASSNLWEEMDKFIVDGIFENTGERVEHIRKYQTFTFNENEFDSKLNKKYIDCKRKINNYVVNGVKDYLHKKYELLYLSDPNNELLLAFDKIIDEYIEIKNLED